MEIDVNKISTALRTAGINLNEYFTGMKGLDEIFLELAQKWDSLTSVQQRYIATQAAGSRQQSRFIAMMSNYDRTVELVNAANNSAGASQEQFNKTLESMETSLAKLKNAWDEFTMGLANNEILKAGIDLLTDLINTINSGTEALSGGNGLIKSILNLGVVFGGLKLGKTAFNKLFISLTTASGAEGTKAGANFINKFRASLRGQSVYLSKEGRNLAQNLSKDMMSANDLSNAFDKMGDKSVKQFTSSFKNFGPTILNNFRKQTAGLPPAAKEMADKAANEFEANFKVDPKGAFNSLNNSFGEIKKAAGEAGEQMGDELSMEGVGKEVQIQTSKMTQGLTIAGTAAIGAGMAFNVLGSALSEAGFEEAGETIQEVGGWLMALGPIAMAAGQMVGTGAWAALGPWALLAAAITGIIALFVHLNNVAKKNSIEGRMEAAAKATEAAKESAEAAKQAYDDLLSDKSAYNELQKALSDLTRETDEWKQKLIEVNQQVLELLTTYPELAQYLDRGADGQLIIQEEGWNKVIESQQKAVQNSSAAVLASQMDEELLKQEKAAQNLQKKLISRHSNVSPLGLLDVESGDAFSAADSQYDLGFIYEQATMDAMLAAFKDDPEGLKLQLKMEKLNIQPH